MITHVTYTYETSDGTIFDYEEDAKAWDNILSLFESVRMLDQQLRATNDLSTVAYVYVKTQAQMDAFNTVSKKEGYAAVINKPGRHRYDDVSDSYINIDDEIAKLHKVKVALDKEEGD